MRYVRVCRDVDTGEVLAVFEQPVPFVHGGIVLWEGRQTGMVDLGAVEDFEGFDAQSRADFLRQRLEAHPLADSHEDAPKVRFRPDATDAPALHFCPTREADIIEHINARGLNALPTKVCEDLRHRFRHRDDVPLKVLRAVGYTLEELKKHPRTIANAQRIEAEKQDEAERAAQDAQQARIERRLAQKRGGE